jgi:hypothetical protein
VTALEQSLVEVSAFNFDLFVLLIIYEIIWQMGLKAKKLIALKMVTKTEVRIYIAAKSAGCGHGEDCKQCYVFKHDIRVDDSICTR